MKPATRKLLVVVMAVVLVPGAAWLSLSALRWFRLGLRMEDGKTTTEYLIGAAENRARDEVRRLLQ